MQAQKKKHNKCLSFFFFVFRFWILAKSDSFLIPTKKQKNTTQAQNVQIVSDVRCATLQLWLFAHCEQISLGISILIFDEKLLILSMNDLYDNDLFYLRCYRDTYLKFISLRQGINLGFCKRRLTHSHTHTSAAEQILKIIISMLLIIEDNSGRFRVNSMLYIHFS